MSLPLGGRYVERVDTVEHDGATFREGDVIRTTGYHGVIGTILELYVERHPNTPGPRAFAEVMVQGAPMRVWFLRDKPEHYALGVEVAAGAPREGMLW